MSESIGKIRSKKSGPNYTYAVLSVALVLFLLGCFALVALHTEQLIRMMKVLVNILVEIHPDTTEGSIEELMKHIDTSYYTKTSTVQFISKEEALEALKNELGDDFLQFNFQNPLYDMIRFNTQATYVSGTKLEIIKNKLQINESVNAVYYQEGLVEKVGKNMEKLTWLAIIGGGLLLLVALTLIHNTIKLAL